MLGSFQLVAAQPQGITIKEFHTNLWFFGVKSVFLDAGIWLDFDQDTFFASESFELTLRSPFFIKESVLDLYPKMCDNGILRLLHNEDFNHGTVQAGQTEIHFLEFHATTRGSFLIIKPTLTKVNENTIGIQISRAGLTKAALVNGHFLSSANDQKKIGVYVRFRYEVNLSQKQNIDISAKGFHKRILIDLRVNDIRSEEDQFVTNVNVSKFMFFVILPNSFEVKMEAGQAVKYVRMLEQHWRDYIDRDLKRQLLVYYWRRDSLEKDSFNLLIRAKEEKNTYTPLLVGLTILAVAALIAYTADKVNISTVLGNVYPAIRTVVVWVYSVVAVIVALVAGEALWDLIKHLSRWIRDAFGRKR